MEKRDFLNGINEILKPFGFKRKGNNWVINDVEISKVINLQHSNFSRNYYINYNILVNKFSPDENMKVWGSLGSEDKDELSKINKALDMDYNMPDEERFSNLDYFIKEKILVKILDIKTEADLKKYLHNLPISGKSRLFLKVRKYFGL